VLALQELVQTHKWSKWRPWNRWPHLTSVDLCTPLLSQVTFTH